MNSKRECEECESLKLRVQKLQKEHLQYFSEGSQSFAARGATPSEFEKVLQEVKTYTDTFLNAVAAKYQAQFGVLWVEQNPSIKLYSESHWKYYLQAYVFHHLFCDFENESFQNGGPSRYYKSNERTHACWKSYQKMVHSPEASWEPETLEIGKILCGRIFNHIFQKAPESEDVRKKLERLVTCILKLHFLAFAFEPPARIVRARLHSRIDLEFMEVVDCGISQENFGKLYVTFMVRPGFQIRKSIFKAIVYPSHEIPVMDMV